MATSLSRRSPSSVHPTRQQLEDLDALLKRMLDLPVNRLDDEPDNDVGDAPPPAQDEVRPTALSASEPMRRPHRPAFARPPEAAAPSSAYSNTLHPNEADLKPRVIIVAPNSPENQTHSDAEDAARPPRERAEERQTGGRPDDWVPLTTSWRPSSQTWKPLTEAWQQAQDPNSQAAPIKNMEEANRGRLEERNREIPLTEPMVQSQASVDSPLPLFPSSPLLLSPPSPEIKARLRASTPPSPPVKTPWHLWPFVRFNAAFDVCLAPFGSVGGSLSGPTGRALLGIIGLLCLTAAIALAAADWIGWTS